MSIAYNRKSVIGRPRFTLSRIITGILACSIIISPIYVFPSGNPQPTDFVMLLFLALFGSQLITQRIPKNAGRLASLFCLLLSWVFAVQFYWAGIYQEMSLRPFVFFFYNGLVAVFLLAYLERNPKSITVIRRCFNLALIVSAFGLFIEFLAPSFFLVASDKGRATGFFNNPNQVAYFSLLSMGIIAVIDRFRFSKKALDVAGYIAGIFSLLLVASLAGWASALLIISGYILRNGVRISSIIRLFMGIAIIGATIFAIDDAKDGLISGQVERRLAVFDRKVGAVAEDRGYDRIMAFPEHLTFGAGEGYNERFYPYCCSEIHSTVGNMAFSYGMPGLILLVSIWVFFLQKTNFFTLFAFGAFFIYGLTHMGLRFTPSWILLVVIFFTTVLQPHKGSKLSSPGPSLRSQLP